MRRSNNNPFSARILRVCRRRVAVYINTRRGHEILIALVAAKSEKSLIISFNAVCIYVYTEREFCE